MKTPEFGQVVVDPDTFNELEAAIRAAIDNEEPPHWSTRLRLKMLAGWLLHPFGVHNWVRFRAFDPSSERIIETSHWICGHASCDKARW